MLSQSRKNIEATLDVLMGGRAAEELFMGEDQVTTGCGSDLQRATNIAYSYIRDLGMLDKDLFLNQESKNMSDEYKYKVDALAHGLLKESLERSKKILIDNQDKFNELVLKLVEKETLTGDELNQVFSKL